MKPYGVNRRWDEPCCPGHSKYPKDSYNNNRSKRAQTRDTKIAHRRERRIVKTTNKVYELQNLQRYVAVYLPDDSTHLSPTKGGFITQYQAQEYIKSRLCKSCLESLDDPNEEFPFPLCTQCGAE